MGKDKEACFGNEAGMVGKRQITAEGGWCGERKVSKTIGRDNLGKMISLMFHTVKQTASRLVVTSIY